MRRLLRITVIFLALTLLGAVIYDTTHVLRWSGATELTVEFVVLDAETGQPVDGAVLHIFGCSSRGIGEAHFHTTTEPDGVAQLVIPYYACDGVLSRLHFTDTRVVSNPNWTIVSVTAPGYQALGTFSIREEPYRREITHTGPSKDHLVVPIALRKPSK